jgi:hypothetical protein
VESDTSPAAEVRYLELLRGLSPERRLRAAIGLSQATRALAEAGIRSRMPRATDEEVRRALVVVLYGEDAAVRLFGPAVDEQ